MLESNDPKMEFINYHGNTSLFALESLRRHGSLADMKLLSISCLMPHLANYLAIFREVHHNTLTQTHLPIPIEQSPAKLTLHRKDFFDLASLKIDCVISHAAIHCFNDTRYGNDCTADGWQKPYQVPARLREIAGRPVPTIVSISVGREEGFFDNNTHLSHEKFIRAFEQSGWKIQDYFFDYVCGGYPQKPEYLSVEYRRARQLPERVESPRHWIAGNYYFA